MEPFNFDSEEIINEEESRSSRKMKRGLVKLGFDKMMSLYGAVHVKDSEEPLGIRIEILSNAEYEAFDISRLYKYFLGLPFGFKYSIWTYDQPNKEIGLAGVYP